ncbi:MAG: Fic family protein [Bacteroidia bacterium]|nr:Fic family protein [Bacteroidia bacterium]
MKPFSAIIKEARTAKNMTMMEAAHKLEMDQGLLSKIESGKRLASRKQVNKLVKLFGLNEKEVVAQYISDKILAEYGEDPYFLDGLLVAEQKTGYVKKEKEMKTAGPDPQIRLLLDEIDMLKAEWETIKPLSKAQLHNLGEYFDIAYTYESNRIEGNTLTMQETALVVNKGITIGGRSMREHLEAINHQHAIDYIKDIIHSKYKFDERLVKDIHALVLRGIDNENAGRYRDVNVRISGSRHVPSEYYKLPELMHGYFSYYKRSKKMHPVLLAANMHEKLVTIHPFIDGNGRTARLIMNLILLQNGYTIAIIPGDDKSRFAYYDALEKIQTQEGNTAYILFIARQVKNSLMEFIKAVKGKR